MSSRCPLGGCPLPSLRHYGDCRARFGLALTSEAATTAAGQQRPQTHAPAVGSEEPAISTRPR
jgi:hypothetical protein